MISVKNLTKVFGYKTAVNDLSFEVESGDILGFLGPNGAGKTTTMRILTGFFPPTSGSATINGVDVSEDPMRIREMVGYLPEHVPLYRDMTVREFLTFAARAKRVSKAERAGAIDRTLQRCNLDSVADQLISTISRGYRQRVGLGQAIVNDPKVLILDEPTVGLDPTQVRDIRALLRELGKSATVILSSHILSEVQQMCNRVIIISDGKVQAMDTPANLMANLKGSGRLRVRVSGPTDDELEAHFKTFAEVESVERFENGTFSLLSSNNLGEALAPKIAMSVVQSGWQLHELNPVNADLEEIFIKLVETEKGVN